MPSRWHLIQVQIRIKWNKIEVYFPPCIIYIVWISNRHVLICRKKKKILMLSLYCCLSGAKGSWFKWASSVNRATRDTNGSFLFIDWVFIFGYICALFIHQLLTLISESFSDTYVLFIRYLNFVSLQYQIKAKKKESS